MDDTLNTLEHWFSTQAKWLQEAMRDICQNDLMDTNKIFSIFQDEIINGKAIEIDNFQHGWLYSEDIPVNIHLLQIENPNGINKLSPHQGIDFSKERLCLVYGENGTGKSGYTRIIKRINNRKTSELLPDIFNPSEVQFCDFSFEANGQRQDYSSLNLNDMDSTIGVGLFDIFDSAVSNLYITDMQEFSFEPKLLSNFTKLGTLCTELAKNLEKKTTEIKITKLVVPDNIAQTEYAQKYNKLNSQTDINTFSMVTWTDENEQRLSALTTLLSSQDVENAHKLAGLKLSAVTKLCEAFSKMKANCCQDVQSRIISERAAIDTQKSIVEEGAKVLNNTCSFSISDKTWRSLWNAAKAYSEKVAYPNMIFPVIDMDGKCPLCQQKLDASAINRFRSFDEYIKGELNLLLAQKEEVLQNSLEALILSTTKENIDDWAETCQFSPEFLTKIQDAFDQYTKYSEAVQKGVDLQLDFVLGLNDVINGIVSTFTELKTQYGKDAATAKLLLDTTTAKKLTLETEHKTLLAQKWISSNIGYIVDEYKKHILLDKLTKAKPKLSTRNITQKGKELSQGLITDAYIARFNDELQALGINTVSVRCKTKGTVGKTYKGLVLYSGEKEYSKPGEVLSEGEARIVSLAAFLADTRGSDALSPLIFDDPISSLDDRYEKRVVSRLIDLAATRQIIVFTHRLTFYRELQNQADSKEIQYQRVEIYRTMQESGRTKDLSILTGNVKGRLNRIKEEKLQQIKRLYQENGCCEEYLEKMTSLCTTIRVTVEDLVSDTLLGDIINRYRPDIQTKGKLNRLADITTEECNLIDDWMTKYSHVMHSKPEEHCPEIFDDGSEFSIEKVESDLIEMIKLNTAILARRK